MALHWIHGLQQLHLELAQKIKFMNMRDTNSEILSWSLIKMRSLQAIKENYSLPKIHFNKVMMHFIISQVYCKHFKFFNCVKSNSLSTFIFSRKVFLHICNDICFLSGRYDETGYELDARRSQGIILSTILKKYNINFYKMKFSTSLGQVY